MSLIKTITVMGATGSIGQSTLALVRQFPELFSVQALVAGSDAEGLAALAREFRPKMIGLHDLTKLDQLRSALTDLDVEIIAGEAGCTQIAASPVDMVVAGIVGIAGLPSVLAAVQAGQTIALANKEALVSAGGLVMREAANCGAHILPVDSEHNAVFQLLQGPGDLRHVDKIVLTASGGPFREMSYEEMRAVTPAQAVAHPNWDMGAKISVDSATMMNKGLELIEARHLFDVPPEKLDALIHPQSIVHGLVYFADGSVLAQKGSPDMRVPLAYCMAYPERIDAGVAPLDLAAQGRLDFAAIDRAQFPCLALAEAAMRADGSAPARLNAANEVAVAAFLEGRIGFLQIAETVDAVLQKAACEVGDDVAALPAIDAEARAQARDIIAAF